MPWYAVFLICWAIFNILTAWFAAGRRMTYTVMPRVAFLQTLVSGLTIYALVVLT